MDKPIEPKYIRTCQECGKRGYYRDPASYRNVKAEAWRDTPCKRCGSEALDYGHYESPITK